MPPAMAVKRLDLVLRPVEPAAKVTEDRFLLASPLPRLPAPPLPSKSQKASLATTQGLVKAAAVVAGPPRTSEVMMAFLGLLPTAVIRAVPLTTSTGADGGNISSC